MRIQKRGRSAAELSPVTSVYIKCSNALLHAGQIHIPVRPGFTQGCKLCIPANVLIGLPLLSDSPHRILLSAISCIIEYNLTSRGTIKVWYES